MADQTPPLLRTPLHARHVAMGARLVGFGGWEMPLQYEGILAEHRAVRERAGLFDLSHMGELWVEGPDAAAALGRALVSVPGRLAVGRAQYTLMCDTAGGIIDDLIVYRVEADRFLVVPNASNAARVAGELRDRLGDPRAEMRDATLSTALLAVQGPAAVAIVAGLTDLDVAGLRNYSVAPGRVCGVPALMARTGYTGEDGFELFVAAGEATRLWDAILEAGAAADLAACGLGARDTLRLEAGMPLYGNELDTQTTPYEAGLGRVVRLDREEDFVGRAALERAAAHGPRKSLVGLELRGPGIARHGHAVLDADGRAIGRVTSGTLSPTLGRAIAMAWVPPDAAGPGTMLAVEVRASRIPAEVVSLPFYRRAA